MANAKKEPKEKKAGALSVDELRGLINARAGTKLARSIESQNGPKEFISTGSKALDYVLVKGHKGGWECGHIHSLSGASSSGKTFLALQTVKCAQLQKIQVVWFDGEAAIDFSFLEEIGINLDNFIYIQPPDMETILETIEELAGQATKDQKFLFVVDSVASIPAKAELESDYDPSSTVAVKARVLSKGLSKLITPLATTKSTLLLLNQLKVAIGVDQKYSPLSEKFAEPGGSAIKYFSNLRVWLVAKNAKSSFVLDENGFRIGIETEAVIIKSRYGTQGRKISVKLIWGGGSVSYGEHETWQEAILTSDSVAQSGKGKWTLTFEDGTSEEFTSANFHKKLEDKKFEERVLKLLEEELIDKFAHKSGKAADFYVSDEEDYTPPADLD